MQSVNCYDRCIINVSGKSTYISLSDLEQVTYNDEHLRKYNFFKIWNMPLKTSCVVYMPLRETFRIKWVCHEVVQVSVSFKYQVEAESERSCLVLGSLTFVLIFAVCYPSALDKVSRKKAAGWAELHMVYQMAFGGHQYIFQECEALKLNFCVF